MSIVAIPADQNEEIKQDIPHEMGETPNTQVSASLAPLNPKKNLF